MDSDSGEVTFTGPINFTGKRHLLVACVVAHDNGGTAANTSLRMTSLPAKVSVAITRADYKPEVEVTNGSSYHVAEGKNHSQVVTSLQVGATRLGSCPGGN